MNYKWIIAGLAILVILCIIYKYRHKILGKSKTVNVVEEQPLMQVDTPNIENEEPQIKEEFVVLNICSSPEENKEIVVGDIYIKLFEDVCPRTCQNFKSLSKIEYKSCVIHRLIKGFMLQTGDYENADGTGGASIYGKKFADENFTHKHHKRGMVSMANSGPNTNGSQFFITFDAAHHLDGKHVVFGEVVKGFDVLDKIEQMPTNQQDQPIQLLYIGNTRITNNINA